MPISHALLLLRAGAAVAVVLTGLVAPAPAAAQPPYDLDLSGQTFSSTAELAACHDITAGDGVRITGTGDVTLRAGRAVRFRSGFGVELGGTLEVVVDPHVCAAYRLHGLNFSPYVDADEDPNHGDGEITPAELRERIERVAPYTRWLRTFGCSPDLRDAGRVAHELGLQMAMGAWLSRDSVENQNQVDCLIEEALAGHVEVAIVGSEVLLRGDLGEAELLGYLEQVEAALAGSGRSIPVTTAEVYGVLLAHPQVLEAVDQVFVNYYPYWEGRRVDQAVAYVHLLHQQMKAAAPGKEVVVSEAGWPSCGNVIGDAIPSPANAAFHFLNFVSWARAENVQTFYFEAFDEGWKSAREGPQGACWGLWRADGVLKEDMQAVFDGEVLPDNWSDPPSEEPILDFASLPESLTTNLSTFLVTGATDPANTVRISGAALPPTATDESGNFAVAVPLSPGANPIELRIEDAGGNLLSAVTRSITLDLDASTAGLRLLYVDVVDVDDDLPRLAGTVVVDLDGNALLGLIPDEHVRGISPDGKEIYTESRAVIGTDFHQILRVLPFTQEILSNGFHISSDGARLYSRNEIVEVASNQLLPELLPFTIQTSGSWASAPLPGDPAASADGTKLYCRSDVVRMDLGARVVEEIRGSQVGFETDLALTPDGGSLLVANYSSASGRISVYDPSNLGSVVRTVSGLGDFVGEIAFSADGSRVVVGSAGNPAISTNGRVSVIDAVSWAVVDQLNVPLADNLATSGNNEFFVASGEHGWVRRLGVQVLVLGPSGTLVRAKTFFLGINRFESSTGKPAHDRIRRIVFKPTAGD